MYQSGQSIPDIAAATNWPRSRVRRYLIACGVAMRSRGEGIRLAGPKLGSGTRGKKRPSFSPETRARMSAARLQWGEKNAAGVRVTKSGYAEYTRGEHKGRLVHVVIMEQRLGRPLREDEQVHHIDGNPQNNSDANLALMTRAGHARHHRLWEAATGKLRERTPNGRLR